MGEYQHKPLYIAVMITSTITMFLMFFFNAMSSAYELFPGIFYAEVGDISDKYYLEITPAGWTFSIWGVIYCWQCLFMGYGLSTICRKGPDGYLYYSPKHNPIWIYAIYILNNCINISWLFMFDREWMVAAFILLGCIVATLVAALTISFYSIHKNTEVLKKNGMMKEVWMVRLMVQNGLGVYCTWCCIATLLNMSMMSVYNGGVDQSTMSTVALSLLLVEIVTWVSLDTFVLHKHTNYLFSPHLVLVWAISGSLSQNFNPWATNTIFTVVLLAMACLALVSKIIIMLWRHFRQQPNTPLVSPAPSPDLVEKNPEVA